MRNRVCNIAALSAMFLTLHAQTERVHLQLNTAEADQVLSILALRAAAKPIEEASWQELFASEPCQRLKAREADIAKRFHAPDNELKDEDFKKFVLSDALLKREPELRSTLARWRKADLQAAARRVLAYLPVSATIRVKIYPVIKPGSNSFVWETRTDPAIFLYLNPEVSMAKFENTVAHELHHIGLASAQAEYEQRIKTLPERARAVADAMAAFGEGLAMLAAAGGPDVHPHAASSPQERARWDRDMANFASDLRTVDAFFMDVLAGKFANEDAIEEKASSFFGVQGPWYTVGYEMAVLVEKRFGREALIETMPEPRRLLVLYNRAAPSQQLPLWSEEVLRQVQAQP